MVTSRLRRFTRARTNVPGVSSRQAQQADPAPAQPRPRQPALLGIGGDLLAERLHERRFPALEAVRQGRAGYLAPHAGPPPDVRHHPPLVRRERLGGRLRGHHTHDRARRVRRPVQPEPPARGQVGQRHREFVPVEPPGQQADHRGRLDPRRRSLVPARLGRRRQDQQDQEQQQPPRRDGSGHGKHDMPSV
jgi:hypothetical protein